MAFFMLQAIPSTANTEVIFTVGRDLILESSILTPLQEWRMTMHRQQKKVHMVHDELQGRSSDLRYYRNSLSKYYLPDKITI
jgi:hypothetical protein